MKYDYSNIDNEDREKWEKICPTDEYRVYSGKEVDLIFAGILPADLYSQFTSVFVSASSTDNGKVYYMANGNRIDYKDRAIDQMPFGFAFIGDSISGSGILIQHGDWINRTTHPPISFWRHITASGSTKYYPLSEMPAKKEGPLSDLKIDSQNEAFGKLIYKLRESST